MSLQLTNRRVLLTSRPKGVPEADHFSIDECTVPELVNGEVLIKTDYWSIDPAMRGWVNDTPNYIPPVELGAVMRSFAVGRVVTSRNSDYVEGDVVSGMLGWQRYVISDGSNVERKFTAIDLSPSLALGVLGLNGLTAYFGLLENCEPKLGDTVVVSSAAGSVGSAVGQIAKLKGCRTVGIAGTDDKVELCKDSFGFDAAINYRTEELGEALKEACPDGIDCYFDNTCGPITDTVMGQLARGARITICGTVALTDWDPLPVGPRVHRQLMVARARMQGMVIFDYMDRYEEAIAQLTTWVREGKVVQNEHVLEGADAAREGIKILYEGKNSGKLLVRVD